MTSVVSNYIKFLNYSSNYMKTYWDSSFVSEKEHSNIEAEKFIDQEKGVESLEDAISGARDIIAEIVNENQNVRKPLRELFMKESVIRSRIIKGKEKE